MDLGSDLRSSTRFARLEHFVSCDSTQARSVEDGNPDSAVFWADHQTAGRGRHGRIWHDAPGQDIAATFRIAGVQIPRPTDLAAAIPVAVVRAIQDVVPDVVIKWPNDILRHGRKLCGILIDTTGQPPSRFHVGIGLNVNRSTFPPDLADQSTSLALSTGREFDREAVLLRLARTITEVVDDLLDSNTEALVAEFRERLGLLGQRVHASTSETEFEGTLTDLDLQTAAFDHRRHVALAHLRGLSRR